MIPLTASPESSVSRLSTEKKLGCAILIMMTNTINTSQIEFWDKNFFVLNVFCIPCTFFLIVHPQQADMVSRWLHI